MNSGFLILLEAAGSSEPEHPGAFCCCQLTLGIPAALPPQLWPAATLSMLWEFPLVSHPLILAGPLGL